MTDRTTQLDDDPVRTATYARGFRNGLSEAVKMLHESASSIRLHAGELSALEMRTVQAVLAWKRSQIAAFSDEVWHHVMGESA